MQDERADALQRVRKAKQAMTLLEVANSLLVEAVRGHEEQSSFHEYVGYDLKHLRGLTESKDTNTIPRLIESLQACPECDGDGYVEECDTGDREGITNHRDVDCDLCEGTGKLVSDLEASDL